VGRDEEVAMEWLVIGLLALASGVAAGAVIALRTRPPAPSPPSEGWLEAQSSELRRLGDAVRNRDGEQDRLRSEVQHAREAVERLRLRDEERGARDAEHAEVVKRLAGVLAGGSATGRAGENVLRDLLAELPPGMLVTDFRVNGRVVEYGLALPDGRTLPIDSKWPAMRELQALEAATDPASRDAAARDVERIVTTRAREVSGYLDPSVTAPVAVAAVPDAAYAALRRAHADAFTRGVVLVPYSCALPVVLFLHSLVSRYGQAADVQGCLAEIAGALGAMESVIENKLARSAVMLSNATGELRAEVGRARGSIARARGSGQPAVDDEPARGGDAGEFLRVVD
jgi:DNA recombination protein RmuC